MIFARHSRRALGSDPIRNQSFRRPVPGACPAPSRWSSPLRSMPSTRSRTCLREDRPDSRPLLECPLLMSPFVPGSEAGHLLLTLFTLITAVSARLRSFLRTLGDERSASLISYAPLRRCGTARRHHFNDVRGRAAHATKETTRHRTGDLESCRKANRLSFRASFRRSGFRNQVQPTA